MKKIKVAILDDYQNVTHHFANWEKLSEKIELKIFNEYIGDVTNLSEKLSDYDVLCLMRERTPLPGTLINKLPNLKLVITSGMWNASVDAETLKEKNIIYCGTKTKIHSTAELAWALIMNSWRGLQTEIQNMKDGNWQTTIGRGLKGNILGIFGLGKQGLQVANYAKAFGMSVIAWSHNLKEDDCNKVGVEYVNSNDLFKMSDILTIHTRLSDRTRGYIDKDNFKLMKKNSVIVNTSRGPIIKEQDLIDAINNDVISCAALDVYDQEPLPKDHILRRTKNLILTPHIGYVSEEAYENFFNGYLKGIEAFINKNPINEIS
ncbi:D-2-hydroxyacid dehydrogenase family protein [Alphaproteobacteria bacterium]|nr:D-2-hydroxyacid dehydrogenase family protein [Alphaproteobacteria bacterium]MDC1085907.1 D-2-hydroxyacid dehydrogenase family protein [Alphaproteobacteria bacterium]